MKGQGRPDLSSRSSTTIMVAVVPVREKAEVQAIMVVTTEFDARDLMSMMFVRLGGALEADECKQANSG